MLPTLDLSYWAAGRIDQPRLMVISTSMRVNIRNIFSWKNGPRIDEDKEGQGLKQRTT